MQRFEYHSQMLRIDNKCYTRLDFFFITSYQEISFSRILQLLIIQFRNKGLLIK